MHKLQCMKDYPQLTVKFDDYASYTSLLKSQDKKIFNENNK